MKGNLLHSIIEYYSLNWAFLLELFFKHLLMSVYGVLFACIIGIPIGIFIAKYRRLSWPVITIANIIQTVPAIAMLAILMLAMGLGPTTVVVTVFLYSLLPIIKNTYTGIVEVDENIKDAGKGMGMTGNQILRMIELPLSLSVIIGGVRIALVVAIGIVAIGSFIGAPTLGAKFNNNCRCHTNCFNSNYHRYRITLSRKRLDPTRKTKRFNAKHQVQKLH